MIKLKNRKKNEIGIMISPMIDMSFLLLVFFIVTTMNMSEVQTVPVQLPAATQAQTQQESRFNVAVREDGSLYLGTKPITREALLAQAKQAAAKDPQFSGHLWGWQSCLSDHPEPAGRLQSSRDRPGGAGGREGGCPWKSVTAAKDCWCPWGPI